MKKIYEHYGLFSFSVLFIRKPEATDSFAIVRGIKFFLTKLNVSRYMELNIFFSLCRVGLRVVTHARVFDRPIWSVHAHREAVGLNTHE